MPAALHNSSAHALLFSLGLMLGGVQEPPRTLPKTSAEATTIAASAPAPVAPRAPSTGRTQGRAGAESEELMILRTAEAQLFGDPPSIVRDFADELRDPRFSCSVQGGVPAPYHRDSYLPQSTAGEDALWSGLQMPELPIRRDPRVEKYVRYFSQHKDGRALFTAWLRRSGRYRELISKAMRDHGVPQDLIALVFVESGFGPTAVSSAGATGLWQFMPQTARAYGLAVDAPFDERRSIWRSTDAAVRHLADLNDYFRSWDLALAAYNYGYKGLTHKIEQYGTEDFWRLSDIDGGLPRETMLYVPKVLAIAVILHNLDTFGFADVKLDAPIEATELEVPPGLRLSQLARAAGTSLTRIRALNPEFRRDTVPERAGAVFAHIPSESLSRARIMLPRLLEDSERDLTDLRVPPDFDWGKDDLGNSPALARVQPDAPADRQHVSYFDPERARDRSMSRLERTLTGIDRTPRTAPATPSSQSEEPAPSATSQAQPEPVARPAPTAAVQTPPAARQEKTARTPSRSVVKQKVLFYRVAHDDTLASIAKAFDAKVSELASANRLRAGDEVEPGVLLRVPVSPAVFRRMMSGRGAQASRSRSAK